LSFGEYVIAGGFNQKTSKEGLFVKGNYGISPHKQLGKDLEDTRRQYTEVRLERLPGGASQPHLQAA
jgi:hypothetical protein